MHPLSQSLKSALDEGRRHIGQLVMLADRAGSKFLICHLDDQAKVEAGNLEGLEVMTKPRQAREWSLYSKDGEYRFTKGQANLKSGFIYKLDDIEQLRETLEHFYPAQLALWMKGHDDKLLVQDLYDKLNRQTGMYQFAKNISHGGAQKLIQKICGPGNQCLKKILWQLDDDTPLEDSEASRFDGVLDGVSKNKAIPMQCQEACNFFVAECRKVSRAEFAARQEAED